MNEYTSISNLISAINSIFYEWVETATDPEKDLQDIEFIGEEFDPDDMACSILIEQLEDMGYYAEDYGDSFEDIIKETAQEFVNDYEL